MSKTWYPTINSELCKNCHKCVEHCRNDVLAFGEDGKAQVVNPERCVENCWGCYTMCRQKAITMPTEKREKIMGCNACGRTPCRFGARGVGNINVQKPPHVVPGAGHPADAGGTKTGQELPARISYINI